MKVNTLQLKRALSAALFVLLLSVAGMKNALAQNQVATLQHNDTITNVFYGANAFVSAYNAAVAGDIITLSSGTFNGCGIAKSLTIHGAGCVYDSITDVLPTNISGSCSFTANNASVEGVIFGTVSFQDYGNYGNNNSFVKCCFNAINNTHQNDRLNNSFVNCIVKSFSSNRFYSTSIINSVIRFTGYIHNDVNNCTSICNSIVLFDNGLPIKNIVAYNSIFGIASEHAISYCYFINCIGIETGETLLFEGQTVQNVMEVDSYEDVFESFTGPETVYFRIMNWYRLKEEIATSFLGHDGTEVGIYGGIMPYKTRPFYMILKNCNVAGQTDENKKLNVEMELFGPGE